MVSEVIFVSGIVGENGGMLESETFWERKEGGGALHFGVCVVIH